MTRRGQGAALVAVNVAALLFGSTALFGELPVSPVWIVAARGGFAALALSCIAQARRTPLRTSRAGLIGAAASGALLAAHWVAFFAAVQWANVAVATLTFATFPLFVVLLEAAGRRRWPRASESLAVLAIVLAAALIAGVGLPHTRLAGVGAAVGLISALAFAGFGLLSQQLARDVHPIALSLWQNVFVAVVLAPFLPFAAQAPHEAGDWIALAALGVLASAVSHQLYFFALKRLPAAVCGGFVSLEPVYAILLAALLFAQPIGPVVAVSAVLMLAASAILLWRSPATVQA